MNKVRLKVDGAKLTKIRESAIISYGKMPNPEPRADERFRYGSVLYEWLGWQDSVWSGSLIAPTPHTPGSFVHSHSGLRSATATRVLHLRSWALYLTAGAGPHPARCTGIGYRRSSSTRS